MRYARPVLRGTTYHVTKRCVLRHFLLTPNAKMRHIFTYCVAVAAKKYGVEVHAVCVMSNHFHIVFTDVEGLAPRFMHWLLLQSANAINAYHGRVGQVWESNPYARITLSGGIEEEVGDPLLSDDDILATIVYTLVNPVAAGLVESGDKWWGLRLGPLRQASSTVTVKRPSMYFKTTPEVATLTIVRPPCYQELGEEEFVELLRDRVEEAERSIRAEFRRTGRKFLGAERAAQVSPDEVPATLEARGKPKLEVAGKDGRRFEERKRIIAAWVMAYRLALAAYPEDPTVEFPPGTFDMKRFGVRIAAEFRLPVEHEQTVSAPQPDG
ncbi:MAG: transposase [Planctomycetota bacterium]